MKVRSLHILALLLLLLSGCRRRADVGPSSHPMQSRSAAPVARARFDGITLQRFHDLQASPCSMARLPLCADRSAMQSPFDNQVASAASDPCEATDWRGQADDLIPHPPSPGGPVVESFTPMAGHPGDRVVIRGYNLAGARVIFDGVEAQVLKSEADMLNVVVPQSTTWPIKVLTAHGSASTVRPFVFALGPPGPDGRLAAIPLGGGQWYPPRLYGQAHGLDDTAGFLQHHWKQPLEPQGTAPGSYSALEQSLVPESCGTCHPKQYQGWRGALHSHTADDLVMWNAQTESLASAYRCLYCHSPLAEERGFIQDDLRPNDLPGTDLPPYVDRKLFRRGVVCAACHCRENRRYGPPPASADMDPAGGVHGGFIPNKAFEDSRFCAGCHTFTIRVNNKIVGNPFEEWRESRFARAGVSCQGCHMPQRLHMWRGIHDRDMVLKALDIELAVSRGGGSATAKAVVTSTHVGHMFPTYGIPMVHVRLYHQSAGRWVVLKHYIIGRSDDLRKMVENFDTRLAPGASATVSQGFAPGPGDRVRLVIDVVPRDDYEKSLRVQLALARAYLDIDEQERVEERLWSQLALRYRLIEMTLPVPTVPGQTFRHVVHEGHDASAARFHP
ncbi:MAG: multiheme c-type cytochrome [Candidatus Xenobia bacterium]